ncbi:DNA-binding MarR family transcriptional regulator [Rhizobium sp. BK529]|uniref:MarR family winged helix-turn-helix transcriptional regulator n=1 Tax=unclassified Rhizobium TaxID=2613769 RepID=UPI0010527FD8|nr:MULTISPECIES: helix-turn-helix domain-containing protein [unclassified Rhizobium]MBB3591016.1 DNA-binding MarR family transcriptional regulator [Rhizobium sp. BK529]TCS09031.1 DNA-binding MarR family transcriptional regulator [Rhizobium sp. BK418]
MGKKPKDDLTDADYEALSNLRYTLRRFMDFSASAAQEEGLPAQQHQALLAIRGHRGEDAMTIGLLAERLLIAPHSATELVGRLVAAGYVSRRADPADKRRQTLELTEKADDVLKRLTAIHLTEIREMAPQLIAILQGLQAGDELEADPWPR